jgi:flagellar basal-body rod protein FlgG
MSVQTLYTAATGMESLQTKLDVVANNLANVNTVSFKRGRANFEDLFYRNEMLPGVQDAGGQFTPTGIAVGLGSKVSSIQTDFDQGSFQETGNWTDMAIEGKGFFKVLDPSGDELFTRAGNFSLNAEGFLVVGSASTGRVVQPPIQIDQTATDVTVNPDGQVFVRLPNQQNLTQAGQINLTTFRNPEGLLKKGENLYAVTDASNAPIDGIPGQNGLGVIRQNFLESSNVEPVQELIDLITTQRSFELNSQAIQTGDQILQLITNLRR